MVDHPSVEDYVTSLAGPARDVDPELFADWLFQARDAELFHDWLRTEATPRLRVAA